MQRIDLAQREPTSVLVSTGRKQKFRRTTPWVVSPDGGAGDGGAYV
jgi:hypothetical protein